MNDSGAFIRDIDPGSGTETKQTLDLNKLLIAHSRRNLHHAIVTGVCNDFSQSLRSMGIRPYGTLDGGEISHRTKAL